MSREPKAEPKMQLLPIEKGIPIPKLDHRPAWRPKSQYRYGLERLEVGDSIYIPGKSRIPSAALSTTKLRLGRLFTVRVYRDPDGTQVGLRIWRVL